MQIALTPDQLAELEAARAGGAVEVRVIADVNGAEVVNMSFGLPTGEVTELTIDFVTP